LDSKVDKKMINFIEQRQREKEDCKIFIHHIIKETMTIYFLFNYSLWYHHNSKISFVFPIIDIFWTMLVLVPVFYYKIVIQMNYKITCGISILVTFCLKFTISILMLIYIFSNRKDVKFFIFNSLHSWLLITFINLSSSLFFNNCE
jgi:hypothetical protein